MRLEKHLLELSLAASALVHAGAATLLPKRATPAPSASAPVEFVTLPPPPPAVREPAPPEPEPEPEAPRPRPAPAKPAPAAPPPAAPAELSGKTLTAEGPGPSFAAPAGDGSERSAPIEAGSAPPPPAPEPSPPKTGLRPPPPPPPPPSTVALQDLARRPEPPALAGALARHYPEDARRRGLGGQAVVRARVDADGKVRTAQVSSESEPGFGAACQRTLLGSRWSPPLDRDGKPVGTWVRYTCRFRVGL